MFRFEYNLFKENTSIILSSLGGGGQIDVSALETAAALANYAVKSMRRLYVNGFQDFRKVEEPSVSSLLFLLKANEIGLFWRPPCRLPVPRDKSYVSCSLCPSLRGVESKIRSFNIQELNKLSIRIGKVYLDLVKSRYFSFILADKFTDVVSTFWQLLKSHDPQSEFLNVCVMLICS